MISSMNDLPSVAAYLARIGAEPRSLRTAVVKEKHGTYWTDLATIKISTDGSVDAPDGYEPTDAELRTIEVEVKGATWPASKRLGKGYELPDVLKDTPDRDLFELKDMQGKLVMIQQRVNDAEKGEKRYIPWTYWTDNVWRKAEPDGYLPLFGLETIKDHTTVFVHEGAKAARRIARLIAPRTAEERDALAAHPWGEEMKGAAHVGWIGGALSPLRTDWSDLAKAGVQRVYIVADNDQPGKSAIPKIAMRLRGMTVFAIEFTETWPASFDLGDDFPERLFSAVGGHRHYSGPTFRDVMHPATWATDLIPPPSGKGKPVAVLRKEFAELWVWIEETDTFICREMPEINHGLAQFNAMVGSFSHVTTTGQLLYRSYKGRTARICYRPDIPARIVTDRTTSAINLHTPSLIREAPGSEKPWLDFLSYLFPIDRERKDVMRWCATLIARPQVRMLYGLLLVSERQGMGKSTLGERILAPLVGLQNTGFPGERDIVESHFNGWVANKRLVVVGEIYTGQSFKAYNILKSYLTDKNINVNEKFQRPYTIENWAHVVACSNSKKALRIEETDRRWFYPELNETPWSREEWGKFYNWLASGGLGIILRWARMQKDYVLPGEHAPMTSNKTKLIEESKGEVLNHWADILAACEEEDVAVSFALSEVKEAMRKVHGKVFETPLQLKKEALKRGWKTIDDRIAMDGGLSYVVFSGKLYRDIQNAEEENAPDRKSQRQMITSKLQRVADRMRQSM